MIFFLILSFQNTTRERKQLVLCYFKSIQSHLCFKTELYRIVSFVLFPLKFHRFMLKLIQLKLYFPEFVVAFVLKLLFCFYFCFTNGDLILPFSFYKNISAMLQKVTRWLLFFKVLLSNSLKLKWLQVVI